MPGRPFLQFAPAAVRITGPALLAQPGQGYERTRSFGTGACMLEAHGRRHWSPSPPLLPLHAGAAFPLPAPGAVTTARVHPGTTVLHSAEPWWALSSRLRTGPELAQTARLEVELQPRHPGGKGHSPLALGGPSVLNFEKGISILFAFL